MSPRRRSVIVGLGSLVAGLGTVVGSGAFSSVSADRTVSIETTGDTDALLGIETGDDGSKYVDDDSDTVEVAIEEANDDAVTAVDRLLKVTNNGAEEVTVGFDILSELLELFDTQTVFKFVHVLNSRLENMDALTHYYLDPNSQPPSTVNVLKELFDLKIRANGPVFETI